MTIPGPTAARQRAVVVLPDGRTGRLIYWPIPPSVRTSRRRTGGTKAKVQLPSGAVIAVAPGEVTILEEVDA